MLSLTKRRVDTLDWPWWSRRRGPILTIKVAKGNTSRTLGEVGSIYPVREYEYLELKDGATEINILAPIVTIQEERGRPRYASVKRLMSASR